MKTWTGAWATATLLTLFAAGCGKTEAGGGAGSETHWLLECNNDSDCEIGSCLCGVCTVACNSLRDCPDPLDVCSEETETGACEEKVCGSSRPSESQQGLVSASPPAVERHTACDNSRQNVVTYTDVGYRPSGPDAEPSAARALIPEAPAGFLLFGGTRSFYRIDAAGKLLRTLPPPEETATYDDAVALPDGSLLLSGRVDGHLWVGELDAAWNLVWERELDITTNVPTALAALDDGGVIVMAMDGPDPAGGPPLVESVTWARITPQGEELWRHQEATQAVDPGTSLLVVSGGEIKIALSRDDGLHLQSCDLDGNYNLAPLVRSGASLTPRRLLRLPDDQVGFAYDQGFLVLNNVNQVLSEHTTDSNVFIEDAAYSAQKNQVYLTGQIFGGGWAERLSLAGESTWSFSREQWPPGPREGLDWNQYGYALHTVAVDAAGHVAARAPWGSAGLDIMWLDTGACGGESVP